jgi:AcrR family transcriptional regulator
LPPRRERRTRADSVQAIIDVTIDLIAAEGLSHITIQRVAERARVSTALVVFHFRSKENLLRSVLQFLDRQFDQDWDRLVRDESLPLAVRVAGTVACAEQFARNHPKWVSVWIAFCGDRKAVALYRKTTLPHDWAYNHEARALMSRLAQEGGYAGIDTDELSERTNCMIFGTWLWCHLNPRRRKSHLLRINAMSLLEQAFPRHFPPRRKNGAGLRPNARKQD